MNIETETKILHRIANPFFFAVPEDDEDDWVDEEIEIMDQNALRSFISRALDRMSIRSGVRLRFFSSSLLVVVCAFSLGFVFLCFLSRPPSLYSLMFSFNCCFFSPSPPPPPPLPPFFFLWPHFFTPVCSLAFPWLSFYENTCIDILHTYITS